MITALKRQKARALHLALVVPVLQRHFQRHFHRRRTIIAEKNPRQTLRQTLHQFPRQLHRRLMRKPRENHLLQGLRLLRNRRRNRRMRVPMNIHPPRRHHIQKLASILRVQTNPAC